MAEAYWIGAALGCGAGIGVAAGSFLRPLPAALAGAVVAGLIGLLFGYDVVAAGAAGGLVGGASAAVFAGGARRRGGTAGGIALLVAAAGGVVFLLGLVPVLGYAEVIALPFFAARARRRAGEKYAGLRSLAR